MEEPSENLDPLVWGQAEQRAAQGDLSFVRKLGSQLADRHAAALEQARAYEHQLAHVIRVLALTPGHDSLTQLLRLLEDKPQAGTHPDLRTPFVASLLAEHQQVTDLVATVFDRREWKKLDELRACLFHELLLRGADTDTRGPLRDWTLVRPGWHPLAWLPTHRRAFEAGVKFPGRSLRGSASGVSSQLPTTGRMDPPTPRSSEPSALHDVATVDVYETIVAAPQAGAWGACGAWVFLLDQAIKPEQVPALLPTLPMACVDGLGPTDRFEIAVRPMEEVWHLLFETASMGGIYSSGVHGAFGRLWAWRSMSGLSGAPADARAPEAEQQARQSTWFHFQADTEWFHNDIGSDYGIAALSPDRRRIAVLAATDTD
ncbi:DUF6183 family protein [Streptomyces sp. NPDC052101]|uniref:DUF6183 family protein n=1 Tax=Streptomyces sp. NPDC052101 TaxID=3155763 RepID=UPI003449F036